MRISSVHGPWETLKFDFLEDAPGHAGALANFKVGLLTINRPAKYNALNRELLTELRAFLHAADSAKLGTLIVVGEGDKAFIAGADIAEMSDMNSEEGESFGILGQSVTLLFEAMPCPVIAAVNGHALGGGCEMAMSMDIILATANATFGQPEVKLGLIPGFGGTQRLSKLIGRQAAKELVFTGRSLKAQEAHELGLVLRVLPDRASLINEALRLAHEILANSPKAVELAKRVMVDANDLTVTAGLAAELKHFSAIFSSKDMREGTKAFVEKRKAQFTGE